MQESAQKNSKKAYPTRKKDCSVNTLKQNLSLTLPVLSTLNEKDCKPFWNPLSAEIQSILSLPIKTASQDLDFNSFNISLNHQVAPSKSLISKVKHTTLSTPMSLSVSLPLSVTPTTEKDLPKNTPIIATKKIRIYPQNKTAYHQALMLYRRAYNIAVAIFREGKHLDKEGKFINLRPAIKEMVKREQEDKNAPYNSIIVDNAVLLANQTFKTVCKNNKAKKGDKTGFSQINFKSRKGLRHSFSIDRLPSGFSPCVKTLGEIHVTESIPEEAVGKTCTVTWDKGRWFIQVQQHITPIPEIQGKVKCVGVDPGVRTFATCFSDSEVITAGENFARERILPLAMEVGRLISRKQKVLNNLKGVRFEDMPQWARDTLRFCDKKIYRLRNQRDNLILDFHNQLAFDLVSHYDVIFLPSFEVKEMTKKGKKRSLRRITRRQMLSLSHYEFKLRLKWYAKKYGKHVVDCNESYTSKTRSWDGKIDENLGSSKTIKGNGFTVDRDINGARNIFIKCLSRVA